MAVPTVGVCLLSEDGDQVLLVRHGEGSGFPTGVHGFPAGRVQEGEGEREAAVRELREETGLQARPEHLLPLPTEYDSRLERRGGELEDFHFRVFTTSRYEGVLCASEEGEPVWIPVEGLAALQLLPNSEAIVLEAQAALGQRPQAGVVVAPPSGGPGLSP